MIQIAIPSYRRAETVRSKTIALLLERGIKPEQITVFVSDPTEVDDYAYALRDVRVNLKFGALSTRANRSAIHRHYPKGTYVVSMDDDITDVIKRVNEKRSLPVQSFPRIFESAFAAAEKARVSLWGVYPVANPYFMKPGLSTDLRFIVGCMYGFIADPEADRFHTELDEKEDYERTIKCYEHDNGVLRLNFIAPVTRYYKEPGGMQEYRTQEKSQHAAEWLLARYPQYVSPKTNSKTGYTEVTLKDRRK